MLGSFELPGLQRIGTHERRHLVAVAVPGLAGAYHQDLGAAAARIVLQGTLAGDDAREAFLSALREPLGAGEPLDFVADITTATEIEQVLIADLEVDEVATSADGFRYALTLLQYTEPPPPPADPGLEDALGLEAQDLFDTSKLPELLSAPNFGNPVPPLESTIDGATAALDSLTALGRQLSELFGSD